MSAGRHQLPAQDHSVNSIFIYVFFGEDPFKAVIVQAQQLGNNILKPPIC